MSIAVVVVIVLVALLVVAAVTAVPRLRERSRLRGGRVPGRRPAAEDPAEAEVRADRSRPREERKLIAEGEAIREQVEARLARERPAAVHREVGRDPLAERDEIAAELAQEHRDRYPASYGAADGRAVAPSRRGPIGARDELAWQLERDERERHPERYPAAGVGPAGGGLAGGGLQPELPPVSDALELRLQEVAARAPVAGRRPGRFARRPRVEPEDDRLAP
ncbi:MAG: hypothetical protein ACR2KV_12795 [Solirubrobacteraceae bacterium]